MSYYKDLERFITELVVITTNSVINLSFFDSKIYFNQSKFYCQEKDFLTFKIS